MPDCPRCGELEKERDEARNRLMHIEDTQANRIGKLEAALKQYGRHLNHECEVYFKLFRGEKSECTCGFDTTLRGTPDG